jgi:hypothetical protein
MSALSEDITVPTLDGWMTLTEAADALEVTRQHAYRMATKKRWNSLHKLGTPAIFVVSTDEVSEKIRVRKARYVEAFEKQVEEDTRKSS